jgi:hypothetical protein
VFVDSEGRLRCSFLNGGRSGLEPAVGLSWPNAGGLGQLREPTDAGARDRDWQRRGLPETDAGAVCEVEADHLTKCGLWWLWMQVGHARS